MADFIGFLTAFAQWAVISFVRFCIALGIVMSMTLILVWTMHFVLKYFGIDTKNWR